jgi:hypothetical protein
MKKSPIFLLIACTLISCAPKSSSSVISTTSTNTSSIPAATYPLSEAAALIASHAKRDGINIDASSLLRSAGYYGYEETTKTRAFILLYRAYKDHMPEQKGARVFQAYTADTPTDVPASAQEAYSFFAKYGLYNGDPYINTAKERVFDSSFAGSSLYDQRHIESYLDKLHYYFGTSEHDDFFAYVNHDDLYEDASVQNVKATDSFKKSNIVSATAMVNWTKSLIESMPAENQNKKNLVNYFSAYTATSRKVAKDCGGLYADVIVPILNCATISDFLTTTKTLAATNYYDPIFTLSTASTDNNPYLYAQPVAFNATTGTYLPGGAEYVASYETIRRSFQLVGIDDSANLADAYFTLANTLSTSLAVTMEGGYRNQQSIVDISQPIEGVDVKARITDEGYSNFGQSAGFLVNSEAWLHNDLKGCVDENLLGWKALAIKGYLDHYVCSLPYEVQTLLLPSQVGTSDPLNEIAYRYLILPEIEEDVSTYYYTTTDYANNLAIGQSVLNNIKAAFKTRINAATWLSDAGKTSALTKLSAMKSNLFLNMDNGSTVNMASVSFDSSSCFKNSALSYALGKDRVNARLAERSTFYTYIRDYQKIFANAFYSPSHNGINICLGFLAAKGGFTTQNVSELYADLGMVIGHEITHGFDANGVKFDETGAYNANWWSAADQKAFVERSAKVASFNDEYMIMPGRLNNGLLTVTESTADLGGVRLCLEAGKSLTGFDNKAFFIRFTKDFCSIYSQVVADKLAKDVHPIGRARTNRVLSSFPEFIEAFDIQPGELMYAAPKNQPGIW